MAAKRRKVISQDIDFGYGPTTIPTDSGGTRAVTKVGIHDLLGSATIAAHQMDGTTWTDKLSNAINALPTTGGVIDGSGLNVDTAGAAMTISKYNVRVILPAKTMPLAGQLLVNTNGVYFHGVNEFASTVQYNPGTSAAAIKFVNSGATTITDCGVHDLGFSSSTTAAKPGAIHIVDGAEIALSNIYIGSSWTDAGNASIGIKIEGRQTVLLDRITNFADAPFDLRISPNTGIVAIDHFHAHDIYCIAHSSQPCWNIHDGVFLTDCIWDGYQAWVNGTYGLYWADTTGTKNSRNVSIQNVRWEQSTNATGYAIYISPNHQGFALNINNCYADSNHKGYYIRNFKSGIFAGNMYEGISEAFNADATLSIAVIQNFFNLNVGSVSLSVTGFIPTLWAGNDNSGSSTAGPRMGIGVPNPTHDLVLRYQKTLSGLDASNNEVQMIGIGSTNLVILSPDGNVVQYNVPGVATGGGATATLGTIGASGPGIATQHGWMKWVDANGDTVFVPTWK